MKITYDIEIPEKNLPRSGRKKCEEMVAIENLLSDSAHKNVVFEYKTKEEALKRYRSLQTTKSKKKYQIFYRLLVRGNRVIAVKTKEKKEKS